MSETPRDVFEDLLVYALANEKLGSAPPIIEWRQRYHKALQRDRTLDRTPEESENRD